MSMAAMPSAGYVWMVLLVAALCLVPWGVRALQKKAWLRLPQPLAPTKLVSSLALGPQQRVVTVDVGDGAERVRLVLGVTAQQIVCLHRLGGVGGAGGSFEQALQAQEPRA